MDFDTTGVEVIENNDFEIKWEDRGDRFVISKEDKKYYKCLAFIACYVGMVEEGASLKGLYIADIH